MRWKAISYYTGTFLRIFTALLLVPVAVGKYYGESFVGLEPYLFAAFGSIILGVAFTRFGVRERPQALEAMVTATIAWLIAVGIAGYPIYEVAGVSFLNAYFEAMSGMTTTGMSVLTDLNLPRSLLFWRAFINWVGGLGILTFFVAVLVEAGGVAAKLVSTEANKTGSGIIRASLFNAIKSVWYVYVVLTVVLAILLAYFDVPTFHAVTHAMATLPTGGYSSYAGPMTDIFNVQAQAVMTLFMFLGGTNFLLIYSVMKGNIRRVVGDYEFRLYLGTVLMAAALIFLNLIVHSGTEAFNAFGSSLFHAVSVTSSAGFELEGVRTFPEFSKTLFLILMFVGGSLGSTTGGVKMLRIGVLFQVVKQQIRAQGIPQSVLNPVAIKGRIIDDDEIRTITAIFVLWIIVIMSGSLIAIWLTPHSLMETLSLIASSVGTMGPVFVTQAELIALHPFVKAFMMVSMLAGRLELLPLLALLNIRLASKFV